MFSNFLIGLREGLEATLVVTILVTYLVKSGRRELLPKLWAGVAAAVLISLAFGALLTFTATELPANAEPIFAGTLAVLAVALVTWMVFWMARSARGLSTELRSAVDQAALAGGLSLIAVGLFSVGREGLETALFLWAATQSASTSGQGWQPLLGALIGLLVAVALGFAFYRGAVRINLSKFFAWTGGLLILVAGGVLSYGVSDLQEAGVLPGKDAIAFNVSHQIPESSWYGTLLKGTLNFSPETSWLQLTVWVLYVAITLTCFVRAIRGTRQPAPSKASAPSEQPAQAAAAPSPEAAAPRSSVG